MYLPAKPGPVAADSRPGAANAEGKEQGLGKESLAWLRAEEFLARKERFPPKDPNSLCQAASPIPRGERMCPRLRARRWHSWDPDQDIPFGFALPIPETPHPHHLEGAQGHLGPVTTKPRHGGPSKGSQTSWVTQGRDDNPLGYRVPRRGTNARQPQLETSRNAEKMTFKRNIHHLWVILMKPTPVPSVHSPVGCFSPGLQGAGTIYFWLGDHV